MKLSVWKDNDGNYVVGPDAKTAATEIGCDPEEMELVPEDEVLAAHWEEKPVSAWIPPGKEAREIEEDDDNPYGVESGWICEATAAEWAEFRGAGVLFWVDV